MNNLLEDLQNSLTLRKPEIQKNECRLAALKLPDYLQRWVILMKSEQQKKLLPSEEEQARIVEKYTKKEKTIEEILEAKKSVILNTIKNRDSG